MYFGKQNEKFSNMYFIETLFFPSYEYLLPLSLFNNKLEYFQASWEWSYKCTYTFREEGRAELWNALVLDNNPTNFKYFWKIPRDTISESLNIFSAWVQQMSSKTVHQPKVCMFKNILN